MVNILIDILFYGVKVLEIDIIEKDYLFIIGYNFVYLIMI